MSSVSPASNQVTRDGQQVQLTFDAEVVRCLEQIIVELQTLNRLLTQASGTPADQPLA